MLPKPLYESMPYFCLVFGAINIIFPTDTLQLICGGLLYSSGAAIWIMRSQSRRIDAQRTPFNPHSFLPWHEASVLPEWLYEAMPFIYILAGILLQRHTETELMNYAGYVLLGIGLFILVLRHRHRTLSDNATLHHSEM